MSDIAGLNIIVGAKIDGAIAGLDTVEKKVSGTGNAITTAMTKAAGSISSIASASAKAAGSVDKIATGMTDVSKTSVDAVGKIISAYDSLQGTLDQTAAKVNTVASEITNIPAVNPVDLQTSGAGVVTVNTQQIKEALLDVNKLSVSLREIPLVNFSIAGAGQLKGAMSELNAELAPLLAELQNVGTGGTHSVNQLASALKLLRAASENATDLGAIATYNSAIEKVTGEIIRLKTVTLDGGSSVHKLGDSLEHGLSQGSIRAERTLTSLTQVVSGIPFGIQGIAFSIEPLLANLKKLQVQASASGKSLLGSLGEAFLEGGGIGIAISVATTAIILFGDKLFGASEAAKAAKKANDDYEKSLDGFRNSAAKQILTLNELLAVSKDQDIPMKTRLEAINKLREVYPSYLKGLSDEQILTGQLGDAYDKINNALLAKVTLQASEEKILPVLKNLVDLKLKEKDATEFLSKLSSISQQELINNPKLYRLLIARNHAVQDLTKSSVAAAEVQKELNNLMSGLNSILKDTAPLELDKPTKTKDNIDEIAKVLAKLKIDRDELNKDPLIKIDDKPEKEIGLIQSAIKELDKLKASPKIILGLRSEIGIGEGFKDPATLLQKVIFKDINDFAKNVKPIDIPVPIEPKIELPFFASGESADRALLIEQVTQLYKDIHIPVPVNIKVQSDFELKTTQTRIKTSLDKLQNDTRSIIENAAGKIADSLSENLAKAFSGGGVGDIFKGLFTVLGEGIKTLGQAMIEYGVAALLAKKALAAIFKNPAAAIAAGFALEVIGTALVSKIPKFGEGGIATSATLGIFGERGAEAVIPIDKLGDFIKPSNEFPDFLPAHRVNGDELILWYERAVRKRRRTL